jgi:hypothetical protein
MATRIETIVWGPAPDGVVVDHANLTITGAATGATAPIFVDMGGTKVSVDLGPDSYTAVLQAVDATGNAVGAPVTDTFVITVPVTSYVIPVSMSGVTE